MNVYNLTPNSERTPEERRELARKGGIASGKARRMRRNLKEALEAVLAMPMRPGPIDSLDDYADLGSLEGANLTVAEAVAVGIVKAALADDVRLSERMRAARIMTEICPSQEEDVIYLTRDNMTYDQAVAICKATGMIDEGEDYNTSTEYEVRYLP